MLVVLALSGCRPPAERASVAPGEPASAQPDPAESSAGSSEPTVDPSPTDADPDTDTTEPEPVPAEALPAADGPALNKDSIRTEVRRHIDDVRKCYVQGLAVDPELTGRVEIQFTIGPQGTVVVAIVTSDGLPATGSGVADCIVEVVKTMRFSPPPGGGNAVVTYPFLLEPDDDVEPTTASP